MDQKSIQEYILRQMPSAVVESRWREKKFSPEISIYDGHYILNAPFDTHEEAQKFAEARVKELNDKIYKLCKDFVSGLQKAKE